MNFAVQISLLAIMIIIGIIGIIGIAVVSYLKLEFKFQNLNYYYRVHKSAFTLKFENNNLKFEFKFHV